MTTAIIPFHLVPAMTDNELFFARERLYLETQLSDLLEKQKGLRYYWESITE